MDVVLIPAYEPDKELVKIARKLKEEGLYVLVVNDGSGEKFDECFEQTAQYATVIKLDKNSGKGAALKHGMRYIKENIPECKQFVTCDADGQHKVEDVMRVFDKLHKGDKFVLTVRQRQGKIPFRSKFGNNLSRFVYALLTNRYLTDNQSGLRGFSTCYLDWMLAVEKNNYDYEMNVLYYAAKMGLKVVTLPIEAIYIGNNESSHFNPIKDTLRIYKSLFYLARGSLIAFLSAEVMILILSLTLEYSKIFTTIGGVGAVSFLIGFLINKFVIFKKIPINDYFTNLAYTIISYFVYTLLCGWISYMMPNAPLLLSFNVVYIICIPLRYYLHKLLFIATLTKE